MATVIRLQSKCMIPNRLLAKHDRLLLRPSICKDGPVYCKSISLDTVTLQSAEDGIVHLTNVTSLLSRH